MATKKEKDSKRSGFDAPVYGTAFPKGTTFKRLPNGKLQPVLPKKKGK